MKEIILENKEIKVRILPELGGKTASIYLKKKDFEIAALPGEGKKYKIPTPDASFTDFDMSGIDDAFPNIDAETITYDDRVLCFPDHGEIWSRGMEVLDKKESEVTLRLLSSRFLYDYRKKICLSGNTLKLSYEIRSMNDAPLPCIWTLHSLMTYKEDMVFSYPSGTERFINVLKDTPLGEEGTVFEADGDRVDFHRLPIHSISGYSGKPYYMKYYTDSRVSEGFCSIYYPSDDVRVDIKYDEKKLPWFGVWINGGGFQGDYNVAMEMTNGYYDSVSRALENKKVCLLKPGEDLSFSIELRVE